MDYDVECYIAYGTPLEPLEEDEAPTKKPSQDQRVTDEEGRVRFHGAFTGGFSAGYFNTVGTKDGWAPSSFTSSRAKKAESIEQHPEDFMDDEDLGKYGIAPKHIQTTQNFGVPYVNQERKQTFPVSTEGPIPGDPPLKDLILPVNESIGVHLLRKMGWRPGQGIGPRVKKRQKQQNPGVKIYGCSLPPAESEEEEDPYREDFTFAPLDLDLQPYTQKDNLHGIGYKALNRVPVLSYHIDLLQPTPTVDVLNKEKKKLSISGQAFGVGAFEDEDEDIYGKDDMSQYDFFLGGEGDKYDRKAIGKLASHLSEALEGFHMASKPAIRKKYFPPPSLPSDFKPMHVYTKKTEASSLSTRRFNRHALTANDRGMILGEKHLLDTGSVFDLISEEDKEKLNDIKNFTKKNVKESSSLFSNSLVASNTSSNFKPYASDPEKQQRYDMYLDLVKQGKKESLEQFQPASMTEWEKQGEKEEFQRAVMLYSSVTGSLNSRFVSSVHQENNNVEEPVDREATSDQAKAAEMKMFGNMTREKCEWHPHPFLCKRFNIPNPFPDCTIVGSSKVKHDKFSLFNILESPAMTEVRGHNLSMKAMNENKTSLKKIHDETPSTSTALNEVKPCSSNVEIQVTERKQGQGKKRCPSIDLFKAIFQDSSSDDVSSSDKEEDTSSTTVRKTSEVKIISTTGERRDFVVGPFVSEKSLKRLPPPPTGVFANLDLDSLCRRPERIEKLESCSDNRDGQKETVVRMQIVTNDEMSKKDRQLPNNGHDKSLKLGLNREEVYGPKLPPDMEMMSTQDSMKKRKMRMESKHKREKYKHKKKKHKEKLKKKCKRTHSLKRPKTGSNRNDSDTSSGNYSSSEPD
ncbi:G patch domain-containing protein 1-like [Limulus polyphemus]|uniref:G patch domain-containing protein 1-like n=1 Tax=Limulus polyphemus TaxID=6850 RepID=A0ABM1B665_LIMPO|nr:G patch domain-containing protein 1-like [Limulus polyphemus]XP_013775610.1 G patch domain-containing protein 1-like [Limulus polyphemus]XP_022242887.1 G patch domain-containing protein 1-like [Limulus polyphemus]XP_022242888.1 G patch domain-containing protein 1-like [Limulus polyphemus]